LGQIEKFLPVTGRVVDFGEGVGQIRHMARMSGLIIPGPQSKLTFLDHAISPENYELRVLEFFNTMGGNRTFAAVGLKLGSYGKAVV
jgi:hypothetical protein